jgi:hypothetical protein
MAKDQGIADWQFLQPMAQNIAPNALLIQITPKPYEIPSTGE